MKGKLIRHKKAGACYEVCCDPIRQTEVAVEAKETEAHYMLIVRSLYNHRFHLINLNDLLNYYEELQPRGRGEV